MLSAIFDKYIIMGFFSFSTLLTTILSFGLSVYVIIKNSRSTLNKSWSLTCFFIGLWSFGLFMVINSRSEVEAIFWNRILNTGAIFIPILYYHFVILLLGQEKKEKLKLAVFYSIGVIFLITVLATRHFIAGSPPFAGFDFWIKGGLVYNYFVIYFTALVLLSFAKILGNLKKSTGYRKQQLKYLLIAGIIGFSGGATNFFPQIINIYPFGNYFVGFYVLVIAYAITRYRLMDIRLFVRKSMVFFLSLISITIIIFISRSLALFFLPDTFQVNAVILIFSMLLYVPFTNLFYRFSNKYFFSTLYNPNALIKEIDERLWHNKTVKSTCDTLLKTFKEAFHIKKMAVLDIADKNSYPKIIFNEGFKLKENNLIKNGNLLELFSSTKEGVLIVEEFIDKNYFNPKAEKAVDFFQDIWACVIAPLKENDNIFGLLLLGPKISGDIYNKDDLFVFQEAAKETSLVIGVAKTYEEQRKKIKEMERYISVLNVKDDKTKIIS